MSMRNRPRAAVVMLAVAMVGWGSWSVVGQPVVSEVEFHQLNWFGPDLTPAQENSLWGRLTFSYAPDDYTWYLNATLANSPSSPEVWAVQNLPLFFVDNGMYDPRRESVYVDLSELGYSVGDDWTDVWYVITVGPYPLPAGPGPVVNPGTVGDLNRFASDSADEAPDAGPFTDPGAPEGAKAGAAAAAAGNDGRAMSAVQEANAHCCAGAFARSLKWLNDEHGLGLTKTAQQIYDDLVGAGVSQPNPDSSTARDEWIAAKNQYARTETGNKIVTKVWDRGTDVDAVNGVPETGGDFLEWLKREMKQGEDVELAYFYPGNAHIVTITKIYTQDGKTYVKYRDDENQGDDTGDDRGDTSVKQAQIYKKDGQYHFGSDSNTIYFAVSESRVQEPVVDDDGDVTWSDPGDPSSNTSKDKRPIRDFVPGGGGMLEFYWTMGRYVPGETPQQHPGYGKHSETNNDPEPKPRRFYRPDDPTITDWYQVVTYPGGRSVVYGGNIRQSSPWDFYPLDELPDQDYRIPDLAPTFGDPTLTIYTAVDLELYLLANPFGPYDGEWSVGDTLNSLGLGVIDGQIPGLAGIYFAVTDFTIDPESPTGWVPIGGPEAWLDSELFQMEFGDIAIIAAHEGEALPEPAPLPWYESFDVYTSGQGLHGVAGWHGWDGDAAFDAVVTHVVAQSEPHAAEIVAAADLVHEFSGADIGPWAFTAWQYIPSDFTSGGTDDLAGSYFMLLNTYNDLGPYHWSVQMQFDSNDGMLKVYYGNGLNTIDVPYDTDRWVKIEAIVDLENDWTQVYYDDTLITEYSWTGGVLGDGGGALDIAAVDLYAQGSTSVFYDDLQLAPPEPQFTVGDLNCDGSVNFFDIDAFVLAITDPVLYQELYPDCDVMLADTNGDGMVNFFDIDGFVELITG